MNTVVHKCPASSARPASAARPGREQGGCPFRSAHSHSGLRRVSSLAAHISPSDVAAAVPKAPPLSMFDLPGPGKEDQWAYNKGVHHYLTELHEKYGDTYLLTREGSPVVFVRDPADIREVCLSDAFSKTWDSSDRSTVKVDYVMNLMQPLLTKTTFSMGMEDSQIRRKALRPAFLASETFVAAFSAACYDNIRTWVPEGGQAKVDVLDTLHTLVRNCILVALLGDYTAVAKASDMNVFHDVAELFVKRYSVAELDHSVTAQDTEWMMRLAGAARNVVTAFAQELKNTDPSTLGEATRRAVVYLLLTNGISEEETVNMFVNLMVAGGEAPASALAHTLEELAFNVPEQTKLRAEVDAGVATMRNPSDPTEFGSLILSPAMSRLAGAAAEGFRLFAPATLVQRQAVRDTTLPSGVVIPANTVVGMCVASIHRDPKQFENPTVFDPTRPGLDFHILGKDRCFMAFSAGPRGCPGRHVAITIAKVALAKTLQHLTLSPAGPRSGRDGMLPKFLEWQIDGIPLMAELRK